GDGDRRRNREPAREAAVLVRVEAVDRVAGAVADHQPDEGGRAGVEGRVEALDVDVDVELLLVGDESEHRLAGDAAAADRLPRPRRDCAFARGPSPRWSRST